MEKTDPPNNTVEMESVVDHTPPPAEEKEEEEQESATDTEEQSKKRRSKNLDPATKRFRFTEGIEPVADQSPPEVIPLFEKPPIVIDHCNESMLFELRASEIKRCLEEQLPDREVRVVVDSEDRDGCFEVREQGGRTFLAFLGLLKPFTPLRNLNAEEFVGYIVRNIKGGPGGS